MNTSQIYIAVSIVVLAAIALLLIFHMGVQALFIGIAGEYLARTYGESKSRPLWVIEKTVNVADPETIGRPHA